MIKLPFPPQTYTGKSARVYKAEAALKASQQSEPLHGPYSVYVAARPPITRNGVVGDLARPITDALTEAGIITDDSAINDIRIVRMNPVKGGYVEVLVSGRQE